MMTNTQVKPNTLVQYKGGGYDGCFWQWNFAYFDKNSKFHCIVSTGYAGCDTEDKLSKFIEDADAAGETIRPRYFTYDLSDQEAIVEFGEEANVSHVIGVAKWLAEHSGEEIQVEEGSLYPALYRMERRDWIQADWGQSELGRRAKFYRLTAKGRRQLAAETEEWLAFQGAVGRVLQMG